MNSRLYIREKEVNSGVNWACNRRIIAPKRASIRHHLLYTLVFIDTITSNINIIKMQTKVKYFI